MYVTKTGKKEKEDRGDNKKVNLRTRREFSTVTDKELLKVLGLFFLSKSTWTP